MKTNREKDNNLIRGILEVLIENGSEGIRPVMAKLLNEAMKLERTQCIKAEPYERSEDREGWANGFKGKRVLTRMGEIRVRVPQTRGIKFYPKSLEKGCRSERALKLAIAEMYVQGVSTRKVSEITELLCGEDISSTQVSRLTKLLDEELEKFRTRPLGEFPYLILDARYEKVRHGGVVKDLAVLIAIGINANGQLEVLGVSATLSEAEIHWRTFLKSLKQRGLTGVKLIISDDHSGLKEARRSVFPSIPWQRCYFHLVRNAMAYSPTVKMRKEIAMALKTIYGCMTKEDAQYMKENMIDRYKKSAPEFADWLDKNAEEGFTFYQFPKEHWRRIKTTNLLERLNLEIKRRTRVARLFPNTESCLRLVSAILQEINDGWAASRMYLKMEALYKQENLESKIYRKMVA